MGELYIKTECKRCNHECVCNRKSDFETLCELATNLHHPSDERINLKDYYEAKVEISCPYFMVNYITSTKPVHKAFKPYQDEAVEEVKRYEGSLKKG